MESFGLALGIAFWPTALIAWLVAGYFAVRKWGRPARIVRNLGVGVWLVLVALVGFWVYHWLFLDEPFAMAACRGDLAEVRIMLARGADPNASADEEGTPVIYDATYNGHKEVVRILIEHGANVNAKGPEGTALYVAEQGGHPEIAKMLQRAGAKE